ncbi:MAG: flagellar hook-associated protein FlgK [Vulcanimicrobiaceae bacterium]
MSFFPQGTFFGVEIAGKSLQAFQYAENITANDIANINTPGASRQQVVFTQAPPIAGSPGYPTNAGGTSGDGVLVQQVQRVYSESYTALYRGASSSQNFYQTEQQSLQAVQSSLGDPNSGISTQYANFQAAISQLVAQASTGSTPTLAQGVITKAQALANSLNSAATTIQTQQAQTLQQGAATVSTVNGILDQIATLNGQIRASTAAGDSPNTYQDQRDNLIDNLSTYMSTQTSVQADGSVLVSVNGQALVNDTIAYHLNPPVVGSAANGQSTFKIDFASNPPAAGSAPGIPLGSGRLAALQDIYNNKLTPYNNQLNSFASSLANEVDRISLSAYDSNGQPGSQLFQPIVANLPITAGNIKAGITDASQLPTVLATTAAGTGVVGMNSANNTVDTSANLTSNASFANPPAATLAGNLSIVVNGVTQTFAYSTAAGPPAGNANSVDSFITNFNSAQLGVTASFDPTGQKIVFTRDPSNESLALRAQQGSNSSTPSFTISDSNYVAATPATSLIGVLGAGGINSVAQDATNAYGQSSNGAANALVKLFSSNVGVPALQFSSPTAATIGAVTTATVPSSYFSNTVQVGQVLTLDGGTANQENVTISAISISPTTGAESITFTPAKAHAVGYSIASAQTQTLGQYFGNFITQLGLDAQGANSGVTTQTTLANSLNQQRQSISGINIDEETQNLIQYQNAYAAAARTLNVLNQNLQTIINNLGVGG